MFCSLTLCLSVRFYFFFIFLAAWLPVFFSGLPKMAKGQMKCLGYEANNFRSLSFMSNIDVDPQKLRSACRLAKFGRPCSPSMTCRECEDMTEEQWARFYGKGTYADRKKSLKTPFEAQSGKEDPVVDSIEADSQEEAISISACHSVVRHLRNFSSSSQAGILLPLCPSVSGGFPG